MTTMFPHFINEGWVCSDLTYIVPSVKEGLLSRTWAPVGQISFSNLRRNGPPAPRRTTGELNLCYLALKMLQTPVITLDFDFMGY